MMLSHRKRSLFDLKLIVSKYMLAHLYITNALGLCHKEDFSLPLKD